MFSVEGRGTMDAKQLTSGLFEVDLGIISADRYRQALRTLSSSIDDKELLNLLQIRIDEQPQAPSVVHEPAAPVQVPVIVEAGQAGAK